MLRRGAALVGMLACAGVGLACDDAGDLSGGGQTHLRRLEGPWPATIEGRFEIADIQDAGGEDYYAFGWIETPEGDIGVHALGQVLESGNAADGGPVRVVVRPSEAVEDSYEIIEVERLE